MNSSIKFKSSVVCIQDSGSVAHSETVDYEEIENELSSMDLNFSDADADMVTVGFYEN